MSQRDPKNGMGSGVGLSDEERARFHRDLDALLDLQSEITEVVLASEMSAELAERLAFHAEKLVIRASHFAGRVAGGDARAIAFRHPEPNSREAFSRFLSVVAEYAAPYAYATLNLGLDTFTWTDVRAILDDIKSLDHGDIPTTFGPATKLYPRGTKYHCLKEQWRAIQWVSYLTGLTKKKEAAVKEVAGAYGVSDRSIYEWHETTERIENGRSREYDLEIAFSDGSTGTKPHFTLSPFRFEDGLTYPDWLRYDAEYYKNL